MALTQEQLFNLQRFALIRRPTSPYSNLNNPPQQVRPMLSEIQAATPQNPYSSLMGLTPQQRIAGSTGGFDPAIYKKLPGLLTQPAAGTVSGGNDNVVVGGGGGGDAGNLGVGPGQGVSSDTQRAALSLILLADKYPAILPGGIFAKVLGLLGGLTADSQTAKMAEAQKAIEAIDKQNAAALERGSSRTFDPYGGTKGVMSVSDVDGNVRSFDPYAGDSAKDNKYVDNPNAAEKVASAAYDARFAASDIADAKEARDIENAAAAKEAQAFQAAQQAYAEQQAAVTAAANQAAADKAAQDAVAANQAAANATAANQAAADKAAQDAAAFAGAQAAHSAPGTSSAASSASSDTDCVDPSTLILLANGTQIPAGELKVGDFLHTLHEDTFVYGDFEVMYVKTVQQPKNIVTFTDGHNLTASDSHKFLMSNRTWKRVDALEAGDTVETAKGINPDGFKTVAKIEAIGLGDVVKLTINNAHTYISEGLVSHNKAQYRGGLITFRDVEGPNPPGPDDGQASLDIGEYVIRKSAVQKYGPNIFEKINAGQIPARRLKSLLE